MASKDISVEVKVLMDYIKCPKCGVKTPYQQHRTFIVGACLCCSRASQLRAFRDMPDDDVMGMISWRQFK